MKGYFSKLAHQTGLRFSGKGQKLPPPGAARKTAESFPLHREETILVAPDFSKKESPPSPPKTFNSENSPKTAESNQLQMTAPERFVSERPQISNKAQIEDSVSTNFHEVKSETVNFSASDISKEKTAEPEHTFTGENQSEFSPIEETIFINQEKSGSMENSAPKHPKTSETPQIPTPEKLSQTEYFKQTAEFLEKGATDEIEIGQILLREVQQWAADSPALPEIDEIKETPSRKIVQESAKDAVKILPLEREAVVIREQFAAKNEDVQILQEQNFSLSIGTISIVLEDAEKPAPTADLKSKPKNQNTQRTDERRGSRLSRYYL